MQGPANETEQRQLLVEIEAVTRAIGERAEAGKASFEVEQGRKLIEKAVSLGLPEASYAELKSLMAARNGRSPG